MKIELDAGDQVMLTYIEKHFLDNGMTTSAVAVTRILNKYAEAVKDEMDTESDYPEDIPGWDGTKEQLDNLGL